MKRISVAAVMLVMTLFAGRLQAGNWAQFRGPDCAGVSNEKNLPTEWNESKNLKWKITLPGAGSSSPVVYGDKLFITCYSGYGVEGGSGNVNDLKRHLLCVNPANGDVIWSKDIPSDAPEDRWQGYLREHGYASSTPYCDGDRVYVFFGKTGALAFDMDGKQLWKTGLGTESSNRRWGSAASPIVYKDLVIVNASEESRTIYALNKTTGKKVWDVPADKNELTYNTPVLADLVDGKQELIIAVPNEMWGFEPDTGKCTWWCRTGIPGNVSPTVLAADGVVYAFGGFPQTKSVAVKAGGENDVTDTNLLWSSSDSSYVPSPVLLEGKLYWVSDRAVAYCMDAKTGNTIYKEKLEAKGSKAFYASVVLADGKLYAVSRQSGVYVLAAKPEFELIGINVFESDKTDFNGSPAVSGGKIFLRSNKSLYCIVEFLDSSNGLGKIIDIVLR